MQTPEIQAMLARFQKEMKAEGLEFFCVAATPNTKHGASIYDGKNNPKGAATHAREAHMAWEKENGIDTKHDWGKPDFVNWR